MIKNIKKPSCLGLATPTSYILQSGKRKAVPISDISSEHPPYGTVFRQF